MGLSIVIPAFNEEQSIEATLKRTLAEKKRLLGKQGLGFVEVILVNDGSTDKTLEKAKRFGKEIKILSHKKNRGYGAALKTGFREAREEFVAFFDADGTYPVNRLPALIGKLQNRQAEVVIGSRLESKSSMNKTRYIGNKLFVYFMRLLGSHGIKDTASGMRAFKRKLLPSLESLPDGLGFTPAMTAKASQEKWKTVYVPIPYGERIGSSKLNIVREGFGFLYAILDVIKLYNPLRLFGLIGLAFLLAAVSLFHPLFFSAVPLTEFGIRRMVLILLFFLIGVNSVFFGFVANFMVKLFYKGIEKDKTYGWAFDRYFLARYNLIGAVLFAAGLALIILTQPSFHWSVPVIGLLLCLVGVQLLVSSLSVKILKELYEKKRVA